MKKTILLMIGGVVALFAAVVLLIYVNSKPPAQSSIEQEIAKLLVQAVAIIIVGALVKFAIEQMTASRDREIAIRAKKKNLLQTIRHIHHIVFKVPFLIEQKKTVECYHQNMSRLIDAVGKLKDVSDDIQSMELKTLPDDVREKHVGEMIKCLNGIVLEAPRQDPKNWDSILRLPLYSEYRSAALKVGDQAERSRFEEDYDEHYESLKDLIREELGLQ